MENELEKQMPKEPEFDPTSVLEFESNDPMYRAFIGEYWKTKLNDLHAISKIGATYSQLETWKATPEFKEHARILFDYKVGRLEAAQFDIGGTGDNRAAEFILINSSDRYKKKKPKEDKEKRQSMSSLVTLLNQNGELDAE